MRQRLRCITCGWIGRKMRGHLNAQQRRDDLPGLCDTCDGPYEIVETGRLKETEA